MAFVSASWDLAFSPSVSLMDNDTVAWLSAGDAVSVRSVASFSAGKYFFSVLVPMTTETRPVRVGVLPPGVESAGLVGDAGRGCGIAANGDVYVDGVVVQSYGGVFGTGLYPEFQHVDIAIDLSDPANQRIWFGRGGVWRGGGDPALGTNPAFSGFMGNSFYAAASNRLTESDAAKLQTYNRLYGYAATIPAGFAPFTGMGGVKLSGTVDVLPIEVSGTLVASTQESTHADVRITLPLPTLRATGTTQGLASARIKLPLPTLRATALTGTIAKGLIKLPLPTLRALSGNLARIKLPLPRLRATATVQQVAHARIKFPLPTLRATALTGAIAKVSLKLPLPTLRATALTGAIAQGLIKLPLPRLRLLGEGVTSETTYCVNCVSNAITTAQIGEFEQWVSVQGVLYGLRQGRLYCLDADTDDGRPITATVRFAAQDFGENRKKRLDEVYWLVRAGTGMSMGVISDEQAIHWYQRSTGPTALECLTIKTGKGVQFHMLGLVIKNREGGPFSVRGAELRLAALCLVRGGR